MFHAIFRSRAVSLLPHAIVSGVLVTVLIPTAFAAKPPAFFTEQQAQSGQQVYSQSCAKCHGAQLQGKAGPALQGHRFATNLQFSKMSAPQLFHFIAKQMPIDHPGSLTQQQYLQVFAYILSQNGFPSGSKPLDTSVLDNIHLLPLPAASANGGTG